MIRLWNTATRKVEELKPLNPPTVSFYACGPTVYQRAHIGNLRTYVLEDVLRRLLEQRGFSVKHVMNITDVGHLTDDVDEGEEKLHKAAMATGESAWDIARRYTEAFIEDMKSMNVLRPTSMPRATDHIQEQIELIQELEKKGHTYRISDGIYFDTSTFPDYGKFSGQALEEKEEGARVEANPEKRRSTDFALWKFSPKGEKRQMEWESPWGVGFPGWHIECSAMSRKELGQPFDLHAGGVDHIPVHHENEIAQSVAAYSVPLANFWIHSEFLLVNGQKMGKSLGNAYTLPTLIERSFDPLSFRYFLLGAHYRQKQNFTWEALQGSQNAMRKLRAIVRDWKKPAAAIIEIESEFFEAMEDDLNTPRALAVVWKLIDGEYPSESKAATLLVVNAVLGLGLDEYVAKPVSIPEDIQKILDARAEARANKDWAASDRLRLEIQTRGWSVEDTSEGQKATPIGT